MKNFFIVILVLLLTSCEKDIGEDYNLFGNNFEISVNEIIEVELTSNPTTGYAWQWVNKGELDNVDSVGHSFVVNNPELVGQGGKEIWKFKGVRSGEAVIDLEYKKSWEENSTIDSRKYYIEIKNVL